MAKLKLNTETKNYKKSDKWFRYLLQELSTSPMKLTILDRLGVPYDYFYDYINRDEKKKEQVKLAEERFEEHILQDCMDSISEYPALKLKLTEKLVKRLHVDKGIQVNIDKSQTVNLLGLSQEDSEAETQALLEQFKGRQRILSGDNSTKNTLIDITDSSTTQ
ncbi:MAG: hypothetical protein GY861_15010 [bacterium]|nr:hypothetical protein [bacterium]